MTATAVSVPRSVVLDGSVELGKDLLGGKAWGIVRMRRAGLPVPPAFALPVPECAHYHQAGRCLDDGAWAAVREGMAELERATGKRFGDPSAPLLATVAGFQLALGYLAVHFTPDRSWFSDSFLEGGQVASWFAASLETTAALVLGVVGVLALRRRAYDGVLAECCAALELTHLLGVLPPGPELDVERARVEGLLEDSGLTLPFAA